jgi:hypothetical protein
MRGRSGWFVSGLLTVLVVLGLAFAMGCRDSENSGGTATPEPSATSPAATSSPSTDIRAVDLANQPDVKDFAQRLSGEVVPEEVVYTDLTGDGLDDAIVPVSSGGTQGDVGLIVVGYLNGKLKALFSDAPAGGEVRVAVTDGRLVVTLPLYAEGDTSGFPSNIKNVYYAWKTDHFVIDHEEVLSGPNRPPRP